MGLVTGDPYGWQDIGYTLSTRLGRLENEIATADAQGGTGLAGAWTGPAASEYLADWGRRHSRYADLIWHAQQAAAAIYNYGLRLADIAVQAGRLERTWLTVGLELGEAGFLLPLNFGALPHLSQQGLRQALTESERDVARIRADIVGAYEDLWTAVRDALIVLEDFEVIGLAGIGRGIQYELMDGRVLEQALHYASHQLDEFAQPYEDLADLSRDLADVTGDSDWTDLAGSLDDIAGPASTAAGIFGVVGFAIAAVPILWDGYQDVRKDGWQRGIEADATHNAGDIASIGVAALIIAAPVDLPAMGALAIGVGVGLTVQAVVDHHKAIGHALDEAASWGERHALGWL